MSAAGVTAFAGVLTALALVISAAGGFITALARYRRWRDESDDQDDDLDQLRDAREALDAAIDARRKKPVKGKGRRRAVDFTLAGLT